MAYNFLWKIHAILMSTSFLSMITGIVINIFFRKYKWRFKVHKRLGIYAGVSGFTALVIAFIMVQLYSTHLGSPHAILGAVTGLLLIATPLAGQRIVTGRRKKRMKKIHRSMGFTLSGLMFLTILSGLLLMGLVSLPAQEGPVPVLSDENKVSAGGVDFSWKIEGTYLEGLMSSSLTGWVAVGFNPEKMMEGADFVIGYVKDGEGFIRDDYGNKRVSHKSDEKMGGSDHVELIDFGENSEGTWLHFRIPLDSGDEYDHKFVTGETIPVIFAAAKKDNFTGMHKSRGKADITF